MLSLAVLVRPSAALLPLLLGITAVFVNSRPAVAYHYLPARSVLGWWPLPIATTMALLVGLTLFPWALRNDRVMQQWVWTDSNAGITLYDGYNPDATGASDQRFVRRLPQLRLMDEMARSRYLTGRAIEFIRRYPNRVPELMLAKAARTWSPMPLSDQFSSPVYKAVLLVYSIPFDVLVLWGVWQGKLKKSAKALLLLPAVYLTVVHALTIGSLRYRLPAEPALAVLVACGFNRDDSHTRSSVEES